MVAVDIINDEAYALSDKNYNTTVYDKTQIVLANTFSHGMKHFNGWKTRYNGKSKRTAPYTIDIDGNIHEHYDPKYHSKYLGMKGVDEQIVPVLIENEGWLTRDIENNRFIDWVGNIYNREDEVVEKKWRGFQYWAPYGDRQLEATVNLVKYLCETLNIQRECLSHNTRLDGVEDFEGICYKSNYNTYFTDLTPAWEYAEFKNKLEIN